MLLALPDSGTIFVALRLGAVVRAKSGKGWLLCVGSRTGG